jgi:hypothetical protein
VTGSRRTDQKRNDDVTDTLKHKMEEKVGLWNPIFSALLWDFSFSKYEALTHQQLENVSGYQILSPKS